MNESEELRQQMWDLAYGLLEPDEVAALYARIKSEPAAARLYAEVRLEADLVAAAAKVEDPSFSVSVPATGDKVQAIAKDPRPREPMRAPPTSGAMNWLAGIAATSLLLLIVYGLYAPQPGSEQLAAKYVVTEVQAPANMPAGLTSRVKILTRDVEDNARPAELFVSLTDAQGNECFRRDVETDARGAAEIEIPGTAIQEGAKLAVGQQTNAAPQQPASGQTADMDSPQAAVAAPAVSAKLPVQAEPVTTYFAFDKPAYQPGETVNFVRFDVSCFSKNLLPPTAASWGRTGAADGVEMETRSLAATGAAGLAAGDAPVAVGRFLMPAIPSALGEDAREARDLADRSGQTPPALALSDAVKVTPSPSTPADNGLRLSPEPNASASRTRKAAVLAEKSVDAARGELPADRKADFAPPSPDATSPMVIIAAGEPIDLNLPPDLAQKNLLVVAMCEGVVVASEKVSPTAGGLGGEAGSGGGKGVAALRRISLSTPPEVSGELTISFYDNAEQSPRLLGEQIVYREPLQRWNIAVDGLKAAYAPGEQVRLVLRVADEEGRPESAALAVRVWNEHLSDHSLAAPMQFAKRLLREEAADGKDFGAVRWKVAADGLVRERATELAKESLSFNYRAQSESDKKNQAGDEATQTLGLNPYDSSAPSEVPNAYFLQAKVAPMMLADNRADVLAQYHAARADTERQAVTQTVTLGGICLVAGLAVLLLIGLQALLRMRAEAKALIPAIALAAASVALGALWMNPQANVEKLIAWRSEPTGTQTAEATQPQAAAAAAPAEAIEPMAAPEAPNDFSNLAAPLESSERKAGESTSGPAAADSPMRGGQGNFVKDVPALDAKSVSQKQEASSAAGPAAAAPTTSATPAPPAAPMPMPATDGSLSRADRAAQKKQGEPPLSQPSRMLRTPAETPLTQKSASPANDERASLGARLSPSPGSAGGGRAAAEAKEKNGPIASGGAKAAGLEAPAGKKIAADPQAENLSGRSPRSGSPAPDTDAELAAKPASQAAAPASLYWNPKLATDDQGRAVIEFTMPEVESTYRVLIDAYGGGRIGSGNAVVVCRTNGSGTP